MLPMIRSQTEQNIFLRIKIIVEKGLGHLFITSSSAHFFNKTDFEHYLFKLNISQKMFRFWKVTSANLEIVKLSLALATSSF